MATPDVNSSTELKALAANLRQHLEAKPTLFDAFSGSSNPKPTEAKWPSIKGSPDPESGPSDDQLIKSALTLGYVWAGLMTVLVISMMIFEEPGRPLGDISTILMMLLCCVAFTYDAIRALRRKSNALEAELREVREQLAALRESRTDSESQK